MLNDKQKSKYDYLIVGSGLYGATFAHLAHKAEKRVLVIEKRSEAGGNVRCEKIEGINVHKYGAHIFHTSNKKVWDFVNSFVEFNRYTNSPVANYKGKLFNLPFNMNTFYALWGTKTPVGAIAKIEEQKKSAGVTEPKNLEEQAINLVGRDIYEILVKEYTEKQWGRKCTELPPFIIKRLPVRFTFDNNYFNDVYQGIPIGGYNVLVDSLLNGIEVRTSTDYFLEREKWNSIAEKIVFTGRIDEFFDFEFGPLEYRSVRFENEILDTQNFQGNAVVNYTSHAEPFTRIIEHKHFEPEVENYSQNKTVISKEFSAEWKDGAEPFYPINDEKNSALYAKYAARAEQTQNVVFGGRLAEYKYYDMDDVMEKAMNDWECMYGNHMGGGGVLKRYLLAECNGHDLHAGSKARNDVVKILTDYGFEQVNFSLGSLLNNLLKIPREKIRKYDLHLNFFTKIYLKARRAVITFLGLIALKKVERKIKPNSILFIQFPFITLVMKSEIQTKAFYRLFKKKNLHVHVLVHDLNGIRKDNLREKTAENAFLNMAEKLICHNDVMKDYLVKIGVAPERIACLNFFDYLHQNKFLKHNKGDGVVFAGNMEKSSFIWNGEKLPQDVEFYLYGLGKEYLAPAKNIHFEGEFLPDELPSKLKGGFGLVWDGSSVETCNQKLGEYLRFNSSHKNSLYIVSRMPIIIWEKAALAPIIEKMKIGFSVASLKEISERIANISDKEYEDMLKNVDELAKQLETGQSLIAALRILNEGDE